MIVLLKYWVKYIHLKIKFTYFFFNMAIRNFILHMWLALYLYWTVLLLQCWMSFHNETYFHLIELFYIKYLMCTREPSNFTFRDYPDIIKGMYNDVHHNNILQTKIFIHRELLE